MFVIIVQVGQKAISVENANTKKLVKLHVSIIVIKMIKIKMVNDSSENKSRGTLGKLCELEMKLVESQDETKLREVQNGWIH